MAAVQRRADVLGQLREAQRAVGRLDADHLVPRCGHQVFLLGLHDARAEPADDAVARVEVQLAEPRRLRAAAGASVSMRG